MNNLKKFATEAEYSAATLNYPAVSWVTSGDTVHFDKAAPTVNDKIMLGFNSGGESSSTIHLYNPYGTSPSTYFSSITFDDVEINPISAETYADIVGNTNYVTKYGITTTTVSDCFGGVLGLDASEELTIEFLIPAQITDVDMLPTNRITKLVIEATTPPSVSEELSSANVDAIYVPDSAVTAYNNSYTWNYIATIYPISQYDGNLPV